MKLQIPKDYCPIQLNLNMRCNGSVAVFITLLGGILVFVALIIATIGIETRQKSIEEISIQKNQTTKSLHLL